VISYIVAYILSYILLYLIFFTEGFYVSDCWDQIAEGYSILNTEGKCEGGLERIEDDYEGVDNAIERVINALDPPGGIPRSSIYKGG
jgi:hypothetical protein